jgi:hypothetical protein
MPVPRRSLEVAKPTVQSPMKGIATHNEFACFAAIFLKHVVVSQRHRVLVSALMVLILGQE